MLLGIQSCRFNFRLQDFHLLWCSFQLLRLVSTVTDDCPTTPGFVKPGLGFSPFARRYLGNRFCFLFLRLLRCFNSPGSLVSAYGFSRPCLGLPHSEISGSMLASSSPERIVGRYVLLRLCVPRDPPLALCSLTCSVFLCLSLTSAFASARSDFGLPSFAMQFSRFLTGLN